MTKISLVAKCRMLECRMHGEAYSQRVFTMSFVIPDHFSRFANLGVEISGI